MMPQADPTGADASFPEIDILETLGKEPNVTYHYVHYYEGHDEGFWVQPLDYTEWHTYGVHMANDGVHYYIDGVHVGSNSASPEPRAGGWGVIFNLAVGGYWPGPASDSALPAVAEMSHLTVWSN